MFRILQILNEPYCIPGTAVNTNCLTHKGTSKTLLLTSELLSLFKYSQSMIDKSHDNGIKKEIAYDIIMSSNQG